MIVIGRTFHLGHFLTNAKSRHKLRARLGMWATHCFRSWTLSVRQRSDPWSSQICWVWLWYNWVGVFRPVPRRDKRTHSLGMLENDMKRFKTFFLVFLETIFLSWHHAIAMSGPGRCCKSRRWVPKWRWDHRWRHRRDDLFLCLSIYRSMGFDKPDLTCSTYVIICVEAVWRSVGSDRALELTWVGFNDDLSWVIKEESRWMYE